MIRRHRPPALALAQSGDRITIRPAAAADAPSLSDLAGLADRPLPPAPLLLAEVDGQLVAARSLSAGDVIADPFRLNGDVLSLLQLRAAQLGQLEAA